jgi:[acyl-carrier-protein] S-malonyltransferase
MISARDRLRAAIATANPRDSEVPVVSNVDALPHQLGAEWASLLSAQLSSPVRWKQVLLELADRGVDELVELGPGGVLTGMAKRTVASARTISVAVPEDLDRLIEFVQHAMPTRPTRIEGEHLFASERLVVSPAAGVFSRAAGIDDGATIEVGDVLGHVGEQEIRSPFSGVLQSYIAADTERVMPRQPIAWLRTM